MLKDWLLGPSSGRFAAGGVESHSDREGRSGRCGMGNVGGVGDKGINKA